MSYSSPNPPRAVQTVYSAVICSTGHGSEQMLVSAWQRHSTFLSRPSRVRSRKNWLHDYEDELEGINLRTIEELARSCHGRRFQGGEKWHVVKSGAETLALKRCAEAEINFLGFVAAGGAPLFWTWLRISALIDSATC